MLKSKYKAIGLIFVLLVSIGAFFEMKFRQDAKQSLVKPAGAIFEPLDKQKVKQGQELYLANCGSCHGANLEGEPNWKTPNENGLMPAPPHDETGHTWHHTDKLLFDIVKYGLGKAADLKDYKTNMPTYENILSDEEIIAIMSYIKSNWSKETQARHDELNASQALNN